ncbi:hypothetical protein [Mesorhizobium ventifaucium]|uniref:Large polyvalent protein associated domain-containing protein n=1 Tax=Mesorhizobium ventifaucium TaxID=666020 RepID=A0ABM9E7Z2_9HYPH|nr:hypothetical protein [Mesorhizobium ventifaucium]CAH2405261.1 conserved hypothetical protein [Mesorhizobium ventifaucium]
MDNTTAPADDTQARFLRAFAAADAQLAARAASRGGALAPSSLSTGRDTTGAPIDDEKARIKRAFERVSAKLAARAADRITAPESLQTARDSSFLPQGVTDFGASLNAGMSKAVFETKDFLVGEPSEAEKSPYRRNIEAQDKFLDNQSVGYGLSSGISQIAVGLIGAGKLLSPAKAYTQGSTALKAGFEIARGALAGYVVLDPHEARLSNLVEEFPDLQNPVTNYLASDPDDTAAEGRFKNALESIGADLALVGAVKVIKYLRNGDKKAAAKEIAKLEKARQANANEFGQDFGPGNQPLGKDKPVEVPVSSSPGVLDPAQPQARPADGETPPEATIEQTGSRSTIDPKTGHPVLPTAKTSPKVVSTGEIPDEDLASILKSTEDDAKAIAAHGSRAQAQAAGHDFGEKVPLPWQKLHTPGNVESLLQRSSQVLEDRFNAAKGGKVQTDARVKSLANELGAQFNEDPALIIGQFAEAGEQAKLMAPRMEAALRLGNRMFIDADDLATKISNGNLQEFGGNAQLATEEFMARLGVSFDTMASANSMLANSGRTLRFARSQFRFRPADIAKLKRMDPNKVVMVMRKAGGDPKKVAMILNERWDKRVMDEATWHLTNGLLWLWPTHVVNMTTNAFMLAARPTEKVFGSAALRLITKDAGKRAELSSLSRQGLREYHYAIASLADGWSNAVEAFRRGDSILNPHNTEFFDGSMTGIQTQPLQWKPWNSIWDVAHNAWQSANYRTIVGLPTRALGGADEFFKTLRYRAVVQSKAATDAADRGLTGQDLKDYVQKALNQAIDPATGRALDANAVREAQMTTFQQDLNYEVTFGGSIGRTMQNARKTAPILAIVMPFVKTPVNVIRYGIKLTPGLNVAQKEFRDALMGKVGAEAQAHAIGQMAMGSMFMGLAANLAANDQFTGYGPTDYKLKQELLSTGWKPYSVTWMGEDGKRQYFQLGRFDPASTAMGLVADIVALQRKNPDQDRSDLIMAVAVAVAKNLGEKTFLLNLNNAMDAALDPENKLPKFLGRTAGSMLPMSSLMRGHNPDPYLREARTLVDNAIRGVPGLSDTLPLSMDVWGDPIERHVGLMDSQDNDIVEAEHNRIMLQTDKGIGKPGTDLQGVDLRELTLKDGKNAYQRLQELSGHIPGQKSLKEVLAGLIKSDAYQDLPDGEPEVKGTRINKLGEIVQRYREAAKKKFLQENVELHPIIGKRQMEARGAIQANRKARADAQPGARALLDALSNGQGQ